MIRFLAKSLSRVQAGALAGYLFDDDEFFGAEPSGADNVWTYFTDGSLVIDGGDIGCGGDPAQWIGTWSLNDDETVFVITGRRLQQR
jgi:hypothetical protein